MASADELCGAPTPELPTTDVSTRKTDALDDTEDSAADAAAEQAVRAYLTALAEPTWPADDPQAERLRHELDHADDPLERVKLRGRLRQLAHDQAERREADFVARARQWAEAHGVTAEALRAEGVPADVLRRAGFTLREDQRPRTRRRPERAAARPSDGDIRAAVPPTAFTLADVQASTGASEGAVRRVVRVMLARGEVEDLGPSHDDAGDPAARVYRRTGQGRGPGHPAGTVGPR